MAQRPDPGDPAPGFSAPVAGGEYGDGGIVTLSDLKGEFGVRYFLSRAVRQTSFRSRVP